MLHEEKLDRCYMSDFETGFLKEKKHEVSHILLIIRTMIILVFVYASQEDWCLLFIERIRKTDF